MNILHVHVPQRLYIEFVEYPTCTCIEQLYIVWMLNSFLEIVTLNAFLSHELEILCHFTHAFILPMYLMSAGGELCLGLEFGTR